MLNYRSKIVNTNAIHDQMNDTAMDERGRQNAVILFVFSDLKTAKKQIFGNLGIPHRAKIHQSNEGN